MNELGRFLRQRASLPAVRLLLISGLVLGLAGPASAQLALDDLVSIPRRGMELMRIDRNTGQTLVSSSIPINLPDLVGCDLRGGNGLAVNPLTREMFALLSCGPNEPRLLAIIDAFNGDATIIGNTADFFAGLAFTNDGTLFAVTGNGANEPNTLFSMSTTDATVSPVCMLPDQPEQAGGQAIAFNPVDGRLYHASGNEQGGGTKIFESIDDVTPTNPLAPCPVTPHGPTGDAYTEATALVYAGSSFLLADGGSDFPGNFYSITNEGVTTLIGQMDHVSKGLAFISGPSEVCYQVKRDDATGFIESVVLEDAIVGPRSVLHFRKAFSICVPGREVHTSVSKLTPGERSAELEDDAIVTGRVCYWILKDNSRVANRTDLEVEDEDNGKRTVQIWTRKGFLVCEKALINTNAFP